MKKIGMICLLMVFVFMAKAQTPSLVPGMYAATKNTAAKTTEPSPGFVDLIDDLAVKQHARVTTDTSSGEFATVAANFNSAAMAIVNYPNLSTELENFKNSLRQQARYGGNPYTIVCIVDATIGYLQCIADCPLGMRVRWFCLENCDRRFSDNLAFCSTLLGAGLPTIVIP